MIDSIKVQEIFENCMNQPQDEGERVEAESLNKIQFDKMRLEKNKRDIKAMLDELPDDFKESIGGGASFLNGCMDKDGEQWTGSQAIVKELFLLGIAIGAVRLAFPKKMWEILPGNMPYYIIKDR